jgi:hypothetical protein
VRGTTANVAAAVLSVTAIALAGCSTSTTVAKSYAGPRTSDGKPDLNGIWQTLTTASWDIQDHAARPGVPAGQGIVDGAEIPYQTWALEKKKANYEHRDTSDPEASCYQPGVPRATYLPFPFQIVQNPQRITVAYEYAHALRVISTDGSSHDEAVPDSWMGDSRGRWEGDALVVDVTGLNDRTWFDRVGNFHSGALHVIERYTPIDRDHIAYEATIDDLQVFVQPWTIRLPLYRRIEQNVQILDYECVAFLEPE